MTIREQVRCAVDGYRSQGASFWPGADHFELVELNAAGTTGHYRLVCRRCVRVAVGFMAEWLRSGKLPLWDMVGAYSGDGGECCFCAGRL